MNHNYERHYNIPLIDDIHNYFPEILYGNINQFQTTQDLIQYIRNQVRNRYDLFSNAQNTYLTAPLPPTPTPHPPPLPPPQPQREYAQFTFHMNDMMNSDEYDMVFPLTSLLNIFNTANTNINQPLEPVIVRPSVQEIHDSTSTSTSIPTNANDICTICQHPFTLGVTLRKINHCQHVFHDICISPWFEEHVRCPICRHDIRDI